MLPRPKLQGHKQSGLLYLLHLLRLLRSAANLTWDDTLTRFAYNWTLGCVFEHSYNGVYGEVRRRCAPRGKRRMPLQPCWVSCMGPAASGRLQAGLALLFHFYSPLYCAWHRLGV